MAEVLINIQKYFTKNIRQTLVTNLFLCVLAINLVAYYRFFFLLVTGYLFSVITSWSLDYVINLTSVSVYDVTPSTENKAKQRGVAQFLFRNETFYRVFKFLSSNQIRNEFKKIMALNIEQPVSTRGRKSIAEIENNQQIEAPSFNLALDINIFVRKLSMEFIESWYYASISTNEQFPKETQLELEFLLNGKYRLYF